jgi:hypothetical protein
MEPRIQLGSRRSKTVSCIDRRPGASRNQRQRGIRAIEKERLLLGCTESAPAFQAIGTAANQINRCSDGVLPLLRENISHKKAQKAQKQHSPLCAFCAFLWPFFFVVKEQ